MQRILQKSYQTDFSIEKAIKKEGDYMPNRKAMIIHLKAELIIRIWYKHTLYKMSHIKVELDLSNYATKADLKSEIGIDTTNLAAKSDLASLKLK